MELIMQSMTIGYEVNVKSAPMGVIVLGYSSDLDFSKTHILAHRAVGGEVTCWWVNSPSGEFCRVVSVDALDELTRGDYHSFLCLMAEDKVELVSAE